MEGLLDVMRSALEEVRYDLRCFQLPFPNSCARDEACNLGYGWG